MTKKVITAAAFLAASTMLANAASVAFTFDLTDVPTGATNITTHNQPSFTQTIGSVTLTGSSNAGNFYKLENGSNPFTESNLNTLTSNSQAMELLTAAGLSSTNEVKKITTGTHTGNSSGTYTLAVSGLTANTDYTVTLLIGGNNSTGANGKISWDGASFNGGSYAFGNSAKTTITNSETEITLPSLAAVQLKFTTTDSGSFNIKLYNGQSSTKTGVGLFAISGSAIPEPSAFGLLAGLGAIALAVSRRRRRK